MRQFISGSREIFRITCVEEIVRAEVAAASLPDLKAPVTCKELFVASGLKTFPVAVVSTALTWWRHDKQGGFVRQLSGPVGKSSFPKRMDHGHRGDGPLPVWPPSVWHQAQLQFCCRAAACGRREEIPNNRWSDADGARRLQHWQEQLGLSWGNPPMMWKHLKDSYSSELSLGCSVS